ncbi:uncharacterized protein AB675_8051 [Cyphellophora attinorum]|uniref:Uncharacterized protein n=1 Tax=Cyphellophora attinorum TaxID=1664694 RepID=A0A0N1NZV8_9EURO|nr:uncharacterized protein AB675_8051 [Phialophora attinorum]KPI41257.1 hypothetical protein AB675_8051 [Phialophora attinorum]
MGESATDVDLSAFGKVRALTIDDLRRYSAANLDPLTVQVGQILCKDFTFSPYGQRNLSNAFDALPTNLASQDDFEIGYGQSHVIHSILKSDEGFRLAAVVGALSEYFAAEVVVELFLQLCARSGLPMAWRPLEHQWRRMVRCLNGVLAASSFGVLLSNVEDAVESEPLVGSVLDVQQLLDSLLQLNDSKQTSRRKLRSGSDITFLTTVAEWLFGLRTAVVSGTGALLYTSQSVQGEEDANVVFVRSSSIGDHVQKLSLSEKAITTSPIRGGRVAFDHLFRSCFGNAFTSLPDDLLAAMIYSASNIVKHILDKERPNWAFEILSQSSLSGEQSVGLADTLTAWFPELRRLVPRFRKYAKMTHDELGAVFDRTYTEIRRICPCAYCVGGKLQQGEAHPHPEQCSATVAEAIFRLSFVLARMFVAPRLLPKRHGIISFLRRYYAETTPEQRKNMLATTAPSALFGPSVVQTFDSSVDMIKSAALIFANSSSPDIDAQKSLMGITHDGLAILSTGAKDVALDGGRKAQDTQWKSSIQVVPGWICLSGHEARLEVYVDIKGGVAYKDLGQLRGSHMDMRKVRQLLRWSGRTMCTTIVHANSEEERTAGRDGWYSLKNLGETEDLVCDNCQTHV